ncbi:uncharacterized protein EDB91DRAFT_541980 [Suillus paluster]|uniref:uncharacterized protein n=1 Tax=Suillus paluster TaxID=48578 RepID=UPI001B877C97|nr:uncharacterized protein EDB91DRAFT_541980 [Suillus paluster]KAG1735867.1 hypothetical protein EDB91DRAFT_541980 [Suillus paluster]
MRCRSVSDAPGKSIRNAPALDDKSYTVVLPDLSRIRDLVSGPDFTPSLVDGIVNVCAAALPAAQFSDLLQTPNIEGRSALYWAIVNNRREALSVFATLIPELSSDCSSDFRLACMATGDHASFTQLELGNRDAKEEGSRRFLGCPPDKIDTSGVSTFSLLQYFNQKQI